MAFCFDDIAVEAGYQAAAGFATLCFAWSSAGGAKWKGSPMSRSLHWLILLCAASFLWAFHFGVNAALASLWMLKAGCDDLVVGLNTGVYYLGIALAALALPWMLRRFGWAVLFAGMLASAVTAAAFPWGGGLLGWFALRVLNGLAAAMSLIPIETYINRNSPSDRRAQNFGAYAFCMALGMALGNLFGLQLEPSHPHFAFLVSGAAALGGAAVVLLWRPACRADAQGSKIRPPLHFRRNFLAFGSGWNQGFMEGCMVAFLPMYLLMSVGLAHDTVSWLMSGLMMGVILAQSPLAWLADRLGRARVLAACNGVTLAGICCLGWTGGVAWLAFWLFVVGACSGAFYPLGLALLGERTAPEGMSRAGSFFLAINSLGSMTGPVVAGVFMRWFGPGTLFVTGGGAIGLILAVWIVLALLGRGRSSQASPLGVSRTEAPPRAAA